LKIKENYLNLIETYLMVIKQGTRMEIVSDDCRNVVCGVT